MDEDIQEDASGPNFAEFAKQLKYDTSDGYKNNTYYSPYEITPVKPLEDGYIFPSTITQSVTLPKTNDITTLFLIDSINRDKKAFPQPVSFTLKLPRLYKNVKSIQLTQLKLLCSFYYFSIAKSNIYLPIIENGRGSITTYNNHPLTELITIREGTYSINDLLTEIQTEMNYTPLFYDFPNGFSDFSTLFTNNGDFSINFNQPGDTYYDSLNSKYIQNPTIALIVSYYWGSRYAPIQNYTLNQLKVAYYYPVFYEILLDTSDLKIRPALNINIPINLLGQDETAYSHMIFNMSGIDDPVALYLINQNIPLLDTYRLNHTFRYSLVNRYELSYNTNSLQVNIIAKSLNTSLVNLINNTSSSSFTNILNKYGLTLQSYSDLQLAVNKANIIYTSMFIYLQTQLTTYLGIPYSTYSPSFFSNLNNILYFQDGITANVSTNIYNINSSSIPISSNTESYSNSPGYWPNINSSNGFLGLTNINTSLIPYNVSARNFQFGSVGIDSSSYYFNIDESTKSVDFVATILPAQYTIFKFRSPVRQNLQVETLPLPYYYRYSDYNVSGQFKGVVDLNKNNVPQSYFDISYSYVYTSTNMSMDSLNYSANKLKPIFGQNINDALIEAQIYKASSKLSLIQFEFIAPYPPGISSGLCVNTTSLSMVSVIDNLSTLFIDNFSLFVYHDRAAFMADIQIQRSENPLHYIKNSSVNTTRSDITIHFSTFSGHTYYAIFRSNNVSCSNITFKPIIYYNDTNHTQIYTDYVNFDPYSNPNNSSNYPFVTNYNPDFIRLPTNSSLSGINPAASKFAVSLALNPPVIGYDISGISNDLTDYIGYIPGTPGFIPLTQFSIDPLNYYEFQYIEPFNTVTQSYLGGKNTILEPDTNNIYIYKGTSSSQIKIVHWYDEYSIPTQADNLFTSFQTISTSQTSSINTYFSSYPQNQDGSIQLGRGINAIGFLPTDGIFEIDSFTFKSAIYPLSNTSVTTEDPNLQISHIGVFSGLGLLNTSLTLSTALTVLTYNKSVPYGPNTIKNTPGFGLEYGTWYEYLYDSSFVAKSNVNISGYTPDNNSLLNYNSMYYMVPFNSSGEMMTYSLLTGSLLPYPLAQTISTGTSFYGKTALQPPGASNQPVYIMPIQNINAPFEYGPQAPYSQTQSQYQQSIPITTPSLGYKQYNPIVYDNNALYTFNTVFSTSQGIIGPTTFFAEYSSTLYSVNSISPANSNMSIQSQLYLSSISSIIRSQGGSLDSIHYLVNPVSTLQNFPVQGSIFTYKPFIFESLEGNNINLTTKSIELTETMNDVIIWMWAGGGATSVNAQTTAGAGAYVKASINIRNLLNTRTTDCPGGISTLYVVVGKGGNRDNISLNRKLGSLQQYEQPRYGGGGTSIFVNYKDNNSIFLQGGGFSGIFSGSNLLSATPLLIVGGGGAAGVFSMGGPGGFGFADILEPTIEYRFITAICDTIQYTQLQVSSIIDIFNSVSTSNISYAFDSNLSSYWNPITTLTYNQTPGFNAIVINSQDDLSALSKIRFYGQSNNLPTGFIVYNSRNKINMLYSNTSILPSDYKFYLSYPIYDITIPQITQSFLSQNAWIIGGVGNTPANSLQYSLDGSIWVPTNNSILTSVTSINYLPNINLWIATGSSILSSSDGINWSQIFNNGSIFTSFVTNGSLLIVGTDTGTLYTSIDGISWILSSTKFSSSVIRLRFINNLFWAIGSSDSVAIVSSDGFLWTNVPGIGLTGVNDVAYGVGRYVIAQLNTTMPYNSPLLYSSDGILWSAAAPLNIANFVANSIVFANGIFVSVGLTTDSTSFIKYSIDGIHWLNSSIPAVLNVSFTDVKFLNGLFICTGKASINPGYSVNQTSILTSFDGITWSFIQSGGFNSNIGSYFGRCIGYGPVTIKTDTNSIYIEIYTDENLIMNEIKLYSGKQDIQTDTSPLIDNNPLTIYYPPELITKDIIEYSFNFLSRIQIPSINTITITTPNIQSAFFTGINIYLTKDPSSIIYNNLNILPDINGKFIINLVKPLINIQSLYIIFIKNTGNSIQISDINASYDPSITYTEEIPSVITDIDTLQAVSLDGVSPWSPAIFMPGGSVKLLFNFSIPVIRINHIRIYNGSFSSINTFITGIYIYSDTTKNNLIYSNTSPIFTRYMSYAITEFDVTQLNNVSNLYIELFKNTSGPPILNNIEFYARGIIVETQNGYSSGNSVTMNKTIRPILYSDGGGGSSNIGGYGGIHGINGLSLKGGSPAISPDQLSIVNTNNIINGAGGGGGGYYGGGGGGYIYNNSVYIGGGGGGGSGFMAPLNIFTVLDSGSSLPTTNYIAPGLTEQSIIVTNNIVQSNAIPYGQGGNKTIDSGTGGHGLVVIGYNNIVTISPTNDNQTNPAFIDGSRLTVFESQIPYEDQRNISFTSYRDIIESSSFSGKNWVWYSSYLSLIGIGLTSSMTLTTTIPSFSQGSFQYLPFSIYTLLSNTNLFSKIVDLYKNGLTTAKINSIITIIQGIFQSFQSLFIKVSYISESYIEFTEIYGILDYLRNINNLMYPHINPANPTLDRILGGVPRFGYWANPFLISASYIGFDVTQGQILPSSLATLIGSNKQVRAIYALVLEQDLKTGIYSFKDIMAYKPTDVDIQLYPAWITATQFTTSYFIRSLTNTLDLNKNIIVQPYTFTNAIQARTSLFKYSVYTVPLNTYNVPVQFLNDFQGPNISMYSFNNTNVDNISSINIYNIPLTSTTLQMNQILIQRQTTITQPILGTLVSEYLSTSVQSVTSVGINSITYIPFFTYTTNSYYQGSTIGKSIIDIYGNYYFTGNQGQSDLYQMISTPQAFSKSNISYASPKYILEQYNTVTNPYSDYFFSKYDNIWHLQGTSNISTIYGVRLGSVYDFVINQAFMNQVFYPTHKIILNKKGSVSNPIQNVTDIETYPSQQHTQMFFYNNFSSMSNDIGNKYAMENSSNFIKSDTLFSGYEFNSYIYNVKLAASTDFNNDNVNSFNYLAIRAYSPSETFQTLVRFYLPQRYDFGYISLQDLSSEPFLLTSTSKEVNPAYQKFLSTFNSLFVTNRVYGSGVLAGFTGSNISTTGFGNFLQVFNLINQGNTSNKNILSTIFGYSNASISNLINGDLKYILPSYLASRNKITDPLEFSILFSSCVTYSNANKDAYGMGYNLGFSFHDTPFNTAHKATSFFKILDDYIYLQLNEEYNMNRMDISQPENFAQTLDTTAQSGMYNSKLLLNNFGSFATTFVQSPVLFNPPVGKIDKISFNWYDSTGNLLNNNDCEWSGAIQIVESVNIS
jgi:hypothetical protein